MPAIQRYLNLFTTYASSHQANGGGQEGRGDQAVKQKLIHLENDLTRAFIIVLSQLSGRQGSGGRAVQRLMETWTGSKWPASQKFYLQKSPSHLKKQLKRCTKTWVMGLVKHQVDYIQDAEEGKEDEKGTTDDWIIAEPLLPGVFNHIGDPRHRR